MQTEPASKGMFRNKMATITQGIYNTHTHNTQTHTQTHRHTHTHTHTRTIVYPMAVGKAYMQSKIRCFLLLLFMINSHVPPSLSIVTKLSEKILRIYYNLLINLISKDVAAFRKYFPAMLCVF